ncbi:MAG: CHC2 zinc finger domain-containing protein, partial [Clostridium sp.]|nr:CHC2 zinc finger domain-containing protein [Clostridium sp.]
MTRDDALTACKARIAEYLASQGIDPNKPFTCFSPGHEDTHPSMSLDRARNKVHCFSCGADYDVIDLIGLDYGLEGAALFNKAYDFFGLHVDGDGENVRKPGNSTSATMHAAERQPVVADYTAYFADCRAR